MSNLTVLKNRYMDEQSDHNASAFMKALFAADLHVPFDLVKNEKTGETAPMSLPAARIISADGKQYRCLLAFSDENEVQDEWSEDFAWTTLRFQQLVDLTKASPDIPDIALDPLTDTMIITPAMIKDYQAGRFGA